MKILYLDWGSFGRDEIIEAFTKAGHEIILFPFDAHTERQNNNLNLKLTESIKAVKPDFVYSYNYFPQVSNTCNNLNTKYVAWIYDSPYVQLYSKSVINVCNYIFVFDKTLYNDFHINGINTVYYLPLASDPVRLSKYNNWSIFKKSFSANKADIAFVGSLYNEEHQFYNRMTGLSKYSQGYLEAIIAAQMNVYGTNFIESVLTNRLVGEMKDSLKLDTDPDGVETLQYLYAQYVINRRITEIERTKLLKYICQKYKLDLYTIDKSIKFPNCINHGIADATTTAPYVYKSAKINLNITLRSITSGIPLRAFEILGSEGFLLSNYQADFDDCYTCGEDYVYFESPDDMMEKIEYYLTHEKERSEIKENGYHKTLLCHTYSKRVEQIISILLSQW